MHGWSEIESQQWAIGVSNEIITDADITKIKYVEYIYIHYSGVYK